MHGGRFDNFRVYQVCSECQQDFLEMRKWRKNARLVLLIVVIIIAMVATTLGIIHDTMEEATEQFVLKVNNETYEQLTDAQKVFVGEKEMDESISEYYGKVAHELVNKDRITEGKPKLEWSDKLHLIAYQRNSEIARGIIPYAKTKLGDLVNFARTAYGNTYSVYQMAEEIGKITKPGFKEDHVADWYANQSFTHR